MPKNFIFALAIQLLGIYSLISSLHYVGGLLSLFFIIAPLMSILIDFSLSSMAGP